MEAGVNYFIAKPLFRSRIYDTFAKLDKKEPQKEKKTKAPLTERMLLPDAH